MPPESTAESTTDRPHPCSVRGVSPDHLDDDIARQIDLHYLVEKCQAHQHTATCYKYITKATDIKECRFHLHPDNYRAESSINVETGDICLRCLNGMVNNFNRVMIEAIRCNMDIKFIGTGESVKAVIYYITNYITKTQLKAHVSYAALELAVKKLEHEDLTDDDLTIRAKKLLQKCAYALLTHQELSAQQVATYLLQFDDHFVSHKFTNLYWTSFEKFVNDQCPSEECYSHEGHHVLTDDTATDDTATNELGLDNQPSDDIDNMLVPEDGDDEMNQIDEPLDTENLDDLADDEDEITFSVEDDGAVRPLASQVLDYITRPAALHHICLWDFIAQIKKVTKRNQTSDSSANSDIEATDLADGDNTHQSDRALLQLDTRTRPRFSLPVEHPEHDHKDMQIIHPHNRFIPVPIGPAIPRRDRVALYPKYCRLMLILFKPWRAVTDLKSNHQQWTNAFEAFRTYCTPECAVIIDNMQVLHECKDSHDDHIKRRQREQMQRQPSAPQTTYTDLPTSIQGDISVELEEADFLDQLRDIQRSRSFTDLDLYETATECVDHANNYSLFDSDVYSAKFDDTDLNVQEDDVEMLNDGLETIWENEYKARRDAWKDKVKATPLQPTSSVPSISTCDSRSVVQVMRNAALDIVNRREPSIRQDMRPTNIDVDIDIPDIVARWTLNCEQTIAFRKIAEHSLKNDATQLRMYIGGAGGTGKSRVIDAVSDWFNSRNQARRFRLASFTGAAAKNINGVTLHAALCLSQSVKSLQQRSPNSKTIRDLTAMWEGVDYLFIDEVSMISCNLMQQIHDALTIAKCDKSNFGGINIIFAGDFAQLPPVGGTHLYTPLSRGTEQYQRNQMTYNENVLGGKAMAGRVHKY